MRGQRVVATSPTGRKLTIGRASRRVGRTEAGVKVGELRAARRAEARLEWAYNAGYADGLEDMVGPIEEQEPDA